MVGRKGLEPSHPKILVPKTPSLKKILINYTFQFCYRRQSDKIVDDVVDTFSTILVVTLVYRTSVSTKIIRTLINSKIEIHQIYFCLF
jgi:hypothetical protein